MPRITVKLLKPPPDPSAVLVVPRPFDHWGQQFEAVDFDGIASAKEVGAGNSEQRAYILRPADKDLPTISYTFSEIDRGAPDWSWDVQRNRYTMASSELVDLARELAVSKGDNPKTQIRALIDHAAEMFGYDHVDEEFNAGRETVPTVCGTTKGSCVDINTFILAGALSLGLRGQYVAGYWFHPDKTDTSDMYCWLAFDTGGKPIFWDGAHHLKWGISEMKPILNPAGGRRFAMSCGRGLDFTTPNGRIQISHFAEPMWVMPGGLVQEPAIEVHIEDEG